jgi:ParB family chromosome partitioning protein
MASVGRKNPAKNPPLVKMSLAQPALDPDSSFDLSASSNQTASVAAGGSPLALDMALIDEDPRQPRTSDNPGFSGESLSELAASIRLRGVKTPISVRDNPDAPGRFLINHGARRFRGSMRAGKSVIPGFIDNDYNEADQVVENLQRNALTAREIADFIGRELAKGIKKGEIARAISKSPAFVTQHVTLLDLPDPIATAFNSGRVRDVTVVNELVTAFKKQPSEVAGWLGDESQEITRSAVMLLRAFLDEKRMHEQRCDDDGFDDPVGEDAFVSSDSPDEPASQDIRSMDTRARLDDPARLRKVIVKVQHDKRSAHLILNRRPQAEGFAWLKFQDDGQEAEVNLADVQLLALLEV